MNQLRPACDEPSSHDAEAIRTQGVTMKSITYFEIHASAPDAVIAFYTRLFGWKFSAAGKDGNYWVISDGLMPETTIGGMKCRVGAHIVNDRPFNAFVAIFSVASPKRVMNEATALGGHVIEKQAPAPGLGEISYIQDPDGNIFGICRE